MCVEREARMSLAMKTIVRGYLKKQVVFESHVEVTAENLDALVKSMVTEHAPEFAAGRLGMIEFEFPQFPPNSRFYRIGPDPAGMVQPLRII